MDETIPVAFLRECFEHREDGKLIWRERPAHHFPSQLYQAVFNSRHSGKVAGTPNAEDYLVVSVMWLGRQRKLLAARVIWAMHHGVWPTHPLDHINRVRDDNRIENLRDVPWSVNASNRGARGSYKKATAVAAVALITACGGGGGGGSGGGMPMLPLAPVAAPASAPAPATPARDCSITLYGDSILNGSTFSAGRIAEPPAAGIQRLRPAYRVVDRSQAGDNAQQRMPSMLNDAIDTRVVVIEQGLNDAANSLPYEAPLRAMAQRAKTLGKAVVIAGIPQTVTGTANYDAYTAIARRVASEEGATFADWGAVPVVPADMADDVHPAQAQSTRLVEQLVKALDVVAPECK